MFWVFFKATVLRAGEMSTVKVVFVLFTLAEVPSSILSTHMEQLMSVLLQFQGKWHTFGLHTLVNIHAYNYRSK